MKKGNINLAILIIVVFISSIRLHASDNLEKSIQLALHSQFFNKCSNFMVYGALSTLQMYITIKILAKTKEKKAKSITTCSAIESVIVKKSRYFIPHDSVSEIITHFKKFF